MRNLKNLRHLILDACRSLSETPYKVGELTQLRSLGKFIVGCNKGNQLEELQCLNLGGNLQIMHLERVENPQDAKKANLAEKHNLRNLSLEWEASKLRGDRDEKVVEQLEPHPNIEILRIRGFSGEHFPNWMVTMEKLVRVHIYDCPNLLDLFQLEDLPHLEFLKLENLAVVEYIGRGGDAQISKFPSLRVLVLRNLPNLKGFLKGEAGVMYPNLERLEVWGCPSLEMPRRSHFKKLEKWTCDSSLCLASIPKLDNLKKLDAYIGKNMKCIPSESLQFLTNLETLSIWDADDEQCLPVQGLQGLTSLRQLYLWYIKLTCLPGEWLRHITTLEELIIQFSSTLIELPEEIKYLESLRQITLNGLEKMEYIPEALKHLSSLKVIRLWSLAALASMPEWLGDLTNLRSLEISHCPKLESLPCCIKGMVNLENMEVIGSPKLTRLCEKGKGEDWDKIAHIPKLRIC